METLDPNLKSTPRSLNISSEIKDDPRRMLDESPMGVAQVFILALAVLLAALDGYDVLSMAFVAPAVSHAWGIGKAALGLALSSSLIGMAAGSLGLSTLADVIGRKPIVLTGIALMAIGSLMSAFCQSISQLAGCRIVTGLGIGVMVALTTSLAAEFANARHRPLAVSATTVGFSVGGLIGGLGAAAMLKLDGWPAVFLAGAAGAAVLFVLVIFGLPESPAFLMTGRPANALQRLNRVLSRLGRPPLSALPPQSPQRHSAYRALFTSEMAVTTLRFAAVNLLVSTSAYYVLSWLPQIIADLGFAPSTASMVSATASLVGIPSGLVLGALATFVGPIRLAAIAMIGLSAALAAFGFAPPVLALLLTTAAVFGFFLSGCTGVFYASMAATFTPLTRASGVGFVLGVGRVFSAIGPALAGLMFAHGLTRAEVSSVFAVTAALGGMLLATTPRTSR